MANYRNGIDTKNKLYNSAKKLFFQNGYTHTTVNDIITLACSKLGLFTYYFESKESVASDIFFEYTQNIKAGLAALKRNTYTFDDVLFADMVDYRALFKCTVANPEVSRFYSELSATNALMDKISENLTVSGKKLASALTDSNTAAVSSPKLAVSLSAGMELFLMRDLCSANLTSDHNEAVDFFFRNYYRFFTTDTRLIEEKLVLSREFVSSLRFTAGESFTVTII